MNFYETEQGRRLYGHTLPRIAGALEKIAGSISTPAPCVRMTREVPKDFLTELYWGNYDPSGEPDSEESARYSAEISAAQETLKAQVAPEVWEQAEHIFSLIARRNDVDRAETFATGFRSAAAMLAAGLSTPDSKEAA